MSLYQVTTPVGLPSGELADFSHWLNAASMSAAQACVEAYHTSLAGSSDFLELFTTTTTFGESKVSEINQVTGIVVTSATAGTAFAGTATAEPLPPQVAVVVTLLTNILSRSTRGRYYLPAFTVDTVDSGGRIELAAQDACVTAIAAAHQAEVDASCTVTVYSRTLRSTENVTTISVGNVFDTMRTRRDKLVEVRQNVDLDETP